MAGDPYFAQVVEGQDAVGTLKSAFTAAATILNSTDVRIIPQNWLKIGRTYRVRVYGAISNVVTAQPTFTFSFMMGSVAVWSSGALTTNTTANTLLPFVLDVEMRLDSKGGSTTAKFIGGGTFHCAAMAAGSTGIVVPVASPAVGTGFPSDIANAFDIFCACQTSNAGNAVQCYGYTLTEMR